MRFLLIALSLLSLPLAAKAEDMGKKLEIAQQLLELRPVGPQIEAAVDRYIRSFLMNAPEEAQERARASLLGLINARALEQTTIDAYAETYSLAELEVMAAYFAQPEARSAAAKNAVFNAKIAPQITEMLDQALMRVRMQGQRP